MKPVCISDYLVAKAPEVLVAYGLGSCLAVILHDPGMEVAALAHILLPQAPPDVHNLRPSKFVDTAIDLMLRELSSLGAARERLTARIVGGANMFERQDVSVLDGVGSRNIRAARRILQELGIPLTAEAVGGHQGRSVEFDPATGQMRVHTARNRDAVLIL